MHINVIDQHKEKQIVKLKNIELIIFSSVFISLSVALPWLAHQFKLAGPTYLPMHLFVLVAGLLFGWRAGLIVGLFTPLVSFVTSGMPPIFILPQITIEVMIYGLTAGLLKEKLNLNLYLSLVIALIVGRLGLMVTIWILATSSVSPMVSVWNATKMGWPGILIQIVAIPFIVIWATKYLDKIRKKDKIEEES